MIVLKAIVWTPGFRLALPLVFINFLLKPEIAAQIAIKEGHAITNKDGKLQLPTEIRDNKAVYPSSETLKRGSIQHNINDTTMALYHELWQKLKLDF